MSAQYPGIPVAGGTLLRAFVWGLSTMTSGAKRFARARRHRRDASALARLDRRMLADIGISRSDLRDAFSEPFWEDVLVIPPRDTVGCARALVGDPR